MSESYSKTESDLKFEAMEQRIDNKFDRLIFEMREGFQAIEKRFQLLETDIDHRFDHMEASNERRFNILESEINWLKIALTVFTVPMFLAIIGVIIPIAWTLWTSLVHLPVVK